MAGLIRSLLSRFLKPFVKNLDDVGIQWISAGTCLIRRLAIRSLAITPWLDLESLYIHKIRVECSWKFLWSSNEVLKVEIDTLIGLIVPYSSTSSATNASIRQLYNDARSDNHRDGNKDHGNNDWSPGSLLSLLLHHRLLHCPLQNRESVFTEEQETKSPTGWMKRTLQWGAGKLISAASSAAWLIDSSRKVLQTDQNSETLNESHLAPLLRILSTLLGRIEITVKNCHIRYEDKQSSPHHPFQVGTSFEKLSISGKNIIIQQQSCMNNNNNNNDDNNVDDGLAFQTRTDIQSVLNPGLQLDVNFVNLSMYHNTDHYQGITATDFATDSRDYRKHFLRGIGRTADNRPKHRLVTTA